MSFPLQHSRTYFRRAWGKPGNTGLMRGTVRASPGRNAILGRLTFQCFFLSTESRLLFKTVRDAVDCSVWFGFVLFFKSSWRLLHDCSSYYDISPTKNNLRKGVIWIAVWGYSPSWLDRHGADSSFSFEGQERKLVTSCPARKQRDMNIGFLLLFSLTPSPPDGATQSGWIFPSSVNPL